VPSSYGSTTNTTVSYKTINPNDNTVLTNHLGFWTTGYSQLNRVAYPLLHGFLGEIAFTANAGYQVTLNSFNLGAYNQSNRNNTILRILDGVGNELFNPFNGSPYTVLGQGGLLVTPNVTGSILRLQFGNNRNVGIDNINFDENPVAAANATAVPVPPQILATMLSVGIGALKLRRQKRVAA
jgi:hypothetical protein